VHAELITVRLDRALVEGGLDPAAVGFEHERRAINIHFEGGSHSAANGRFAGETREGGIFDKPQIELGPVGLRFPFVSLDAWGRHPLDGLDMAFPDRPDSHSEPMVPKVLIWGIEIDRAKALRGRMRCTGGRRNQSFDFR
jgi:hypothetical protein